MQASTTPGVDGRRSRKVPVPSGCVLTSTSLRPQYVGFTVRYALNLFVIMTPPCLVGWAASEVGTMLEESKKEGMGIEFHS